MWNLRLQLKRVLPCLVLMGALQASLSRLGAQPVRCRVTRSSDSSYGGTCMRSDTTLGRLTLRRPASATPYLWLGTIRGASFRPEASGTGPGQAGIGVDVRPGGALRLGRAWLALSDVNSDTAALQFSFRLDVSAPADQTDAEILRRARAYLGDPSQWNPADTTDMDAAPTTGFSCAPAARQSMFCALYLASIAVAGDYAHFRPAINAVRQALTAASKKSYRHPLVDFNNDPTRTLGEVQAVLDAALTVILPQRSKHDA